jgi:2'-5' RNA ligase
MRVFIAVDIDEHIRKGLDKLQSELQDRLDVRRSDMKWVKPESIHLTLKFLGEIKDEQAAEVCDIVKQVAQKHSSFELAVESLGCFGGKSARVAWVGTTSGSDELARLQEEIEKDLAQAGWPPENRQFTGHLTLCRIRNSKAGFKMAQVARDYGDYEIGTTYIDCVVVYQSQLTPRGPIYTQLGNYELQ